MFLIFLHIAKGTVLKHFCVLYI